MKKILEITGEPIGTGGQEMFIINLLRHINMTGLNIDWLTPYFCENDIYKNEVICKGGQVCCLNLPFKPGKSRFNIIKPLLAFFKEHSYEVVHIHSGSLSVLAYCSLVARLSGVKKVIVHSHSAGARRTIKYMMLKTILFPLIKFMPTDYCACSVIAGEWKFPKSIIKQKLIILKNGIDLRKFAPNKEYRNEIRDMLGISEKTLVIGHVGRFSPQKNHEFIVMILDALKNKIEDCKLMLIGDGENENDIKALITQKALDDYIIYVGTTPDVSKYMQAMDVFILPSKWEGLPIVGIEAQCVGLPVLVSDKVSPDMKLVDDVKYLPINSVEIWINAILNVKYGKRDNIQTIKEAGYDISDTAAFVRKLYLN